MDSTASFLGVLRGERKKHNSHVYGVHTMQGAWIGGPYPIRSIRDKRYKYIWNPMHERTFVNFNNVGNRLDCWQSWLRDAKTHPSAAAIVRRWVKRPEIEFYDTEKDPFELKNLANDPKYAKPIKQLKGKLESWMKQQGDLGIETELSNPKSRKEAQWQPRLRKYYKANRESYDRILKGMEEMKNPIQRLVGLVGYIRSYLLQTGEDEARVQSGGESKSKCKLTRPTSGAYPFETHENPSPSTPLDSLHFVFPLGNRQTAHGLFRHRRTREPRGFTKPPSTQQTESSLPPNWPPRLDRPAFSPYIPMAKSCIRSDDGRMEAALWVTTFRRTERLRNSPG